MDLDKLRELINLFQESNLAEIEIDESGSRVRLTRALAPQPQPHSTITYHTSGPAAAPAPTAPPPPAPTAASATQAEPEPTEADDDLVTIDSPMVGVFYACPAPGEPAFVNPGDTVDKDQTVCIVEAMKLMNEVGAKFRGVIERVLVENGEPVEYGQALFAVRPLDLA